MFGQVVRSFAILCLLLTLSSPASAQTAGVAADYSGRVVLFGSTAPLVGEPPGSTPNVFEIADGKTRIVAVKPPSFLLLERLGGWAVQMNDAGDLQGYSFSAMVGGAHPTPVSPISHHTVLRNVRDGWEMNSGGYIVLSRDGRWAVFTNEIQFTLVSVLVDLWSGQRTSLPAGSVIWSVADNGSVVLKGSKSLALHRPGESPVEIPLPFAPQTARIDRTGQYAAVLGARGLWRVNLISGSVEPWVPSCDACSLLSIADNGAALLYKEWSWIVLIREPGSGPVRVSRQGLDVYSTTVTGDGRFAIASTADGITRFNLETLDEEVLVPGSTWFARQPSFLAPRMWVRQEGGGLAAAQIKLNGKVVPSLRQSSSDIVWIVPPDTPAAPVDLEIGQAGSPFQSHRRIIEVQRAAPAYITQADAGIGNSDSSSWPVFHHADTGVPANEDDPARPGQIISVLMTGLNDQGPSVEWTLTLRNTETIYRPRFEAAAPHPNNPYWTIVSLRMPATLPRGLSVLGAGYGKVQRNALIFTSDR